MSGISEHRDPEGRPSREWPPLRVIVTVTRGVAEVLFKPEGVGVTVLDYDVDGADEGDPRVSRDADGQLCCVGEWDSSTEVVFNQHWPMVKQAVDGSYSRSWKCSKCAGVIWAAYEELAEVGSPTCGDCDIEMELV